MMKGGQPLLRSERPEPTFLWAALALSLVVNFGAALAFARRGADTAPSNGDNGALAQRVSAIEADQRQSRQRGATAEQRADVGTLERRLGTAETGLRQVEQRLGAVEQRPAGTAPAVLRRVALALGESGLSACLRAGGVCVAMESTASVHTSTNHEGREVFTCGARLRRAHGNDCANGENYVLPSSTFFPQSVEGGYGDPIGNSYMCLRAASDIGAICAMPPAISE